MNRSAPISSSRKIGPQSTWRPGHQPNKAELEADMRIDATPEDIARALIRPVHIKYVRRPKDRRSQ